MEDGHHRHQVWRVAGAVSRAGLQGPWPILVADSAPRHYDAFSTEPAWGGRGTMTLLVSQQENMAGEIANH